MLQTGQDGKVKKDLKDFSLDTLRLKKAEWLLYRDQIPQMLETLHHVDKVSLAISFLKENKRWKEATEWLVETGQ
jgi:hypothetical protein